MHMLQTSSAPVQLGNSGIRVFPIAWGMWRLANADGKDDEGAVLARIEAALASGITLFDTADIYGAGEPIGFGGAEILLGKALARRPELRSRMIIATKGGIFPQKPYDSSRQYLDQAITASLERLGVDQVDLYQIHRRDFLAHPRDTAEALVAMVESGKARMIGVSNYQPAEVDALQAYLPFPLVSTQPEFSASHYQPLYDGTLDQAMVRSLAVLAWSPLGGGRLTDENLPIGGLLAAQGARYGVSAMAAALSWLMVHPSRPIPIVGSQQPARLLSLTDAFKVEWTRSQWYEVLACARGEKLP